MDQCLRSCCFCNRKKAMDLLFMQQENAQERTDNEAASRPRCTVKNQSSDTFDKRRRCQVQRKCIRTTFALCIAFFCKANECIANECIANYDRSQHLHGNSKFFNLAGIGNEWQHAVAQFGACLLYTSPSPRDKRQSRMPSSA